MTGDFLLSSELRQRNETTKKTNRCKDVQMVVTTQKMEQVKSTRGSAPFRATF